MRRPYIYIIMCIALLTTSCQQEQSEPSGQAVLELDLQLAGRPRLQTRAIESDLAVAIYRPDGTPYINGDGVACQFAAGSVPAKIVLEPGTFRLVTYTENQDSWTSDNEGRGSACYRKDTTFTIGQDETVYLSMQVPATNYAVSLQLPELFNDLFKSYTFTLTSGSRTTTIKEGEKAFFDVADNGFTYALSVTNNDNTPHSHSAIEYTEVETGKCFTIHYNYDSDANSGGVVIIISDDMDTDDNNINL